MTMVLSSSMHNTYSGGFLERIRRAGRPLRWFRRRLLRKPASTLALSVGVLFGGAIMMNALALQTERHPSPIFSSLIEERVVAVSAPLAPVPPVRPQAAERRIDTPLRDARTASLATKEESPRTTASTGGTAKDQMLAIIRGGNPETADQSAKMQQVQRALNKAGYGPLKEDGVIGAGTRQALERFEADRRLPVRGEPQGKTLRELARASGVAID